MSDIRFSRPVTPPGSQPAPGEEGGPAQTGARWPLPEESIWTGHTDPGTPGPQGPAPQGQGPQGPAPQGPRAQGPAPQGPSAQAGPASRVPGAPAHQGPAPRDPAPQGPGSAFQRPAAPAAPAGYAGAPGAPAAPAGRPGPPSGPGHPGPQPGAGSARPDGPATGATAQAGPGEGAAAEARPEAEPPRRRRDPFLDNVKFVLIALVVVGHSLVPTLAADSSRALYIFIYTFHMPLFVLISGYLSRNFWNSNAKTNKLVDTFLVPYVIVEVGYAALRTALGSKWSLTIIDPAWLNWYLLALLFWRLSTPVWKRMKYPVPVAIAIYLFAGFSQISGDFSMDRFFGLMPFFVIGLVMQPEHFEMLNRRWIKIVSVFTILGAAAVAILVAPHTKLGPFYYKNSYADLNLSWYMGLGLRTALLICALAMCFAVLALVPRGETWFSDLGTRTLYCYLLHGIPVLIAKEMGWLEFPWLFGPLGVLAIASSCFALAIVLCLPETRTLFKWVLEPRLTWLYRRPSAKLSAGS
ncbi:acyltransferase family protein [Nonomuraea wenchangensis]|uniref:acyltransferase family protein n=1 Tax=Nonomuraea wenchangensis TaxID=568860 RepID=UPI00343788C6